MKNAAGVQLRFWGVRGSIPTPAPENLGFGGNTTCLELRLANGDVVVIDGGTGAHKLGLSLVDGPQGRAANLHFLMTHFHWDHIQGIPFFAPLYNASNHVTFHSRREPEAVREILEGQMTHPYFPVNFELLAAKRDFVRLTEEPLRYGELVVRSFPLNHPQGATGFRLESHGAVIVHACDHEHGDPKLDRILLEHAEDADVLVYDAQFTPEEYVSKQGWGHSTWLEATRIAREAKVKQLVLTHHDPSHNDEMLAAVVTEARAEFENTNAAREGWAIEIEGRV